MMKNDQKQTKTRQANLEKLKKKLNDLKLSRKRLKKNPLECNENYFLFNRWQSSSANWYHSSKEKQFFCVCIWNIKLLCLTMCFYLFLVVNSKHKLIPSIVGDMKVVKSKDLTNDAVSYSAPTYIVIKSTKHSGSLVFRQPSWHEQDELFARIYRQFSE